MISLRTRTAVPAFTIAAIALVTLTACGGSDEPAAAPDDEITTEAAAPDSADDAPADSEEEAAVGALFPGTGEYAIGTDIPYGGFQLLGEPASQPDGCTWSIVDEDGAVAFENQGPYVFLTDIPEAVTFITNGCPDWEQFE